MLDSDTLLQENLTSAGVSAALALQHADPDSTKFEVAEGVPLILAQPQVKIISLEHLLPAPVRPRVAVQLTSKEDLINYLTQQAKREGDNPAIFADRDHLTLTAFLDYHRPGAPSWCLHRVTVAYKESHQFARWKAANGKKMGQEEFATFLEENITDILNPTGADVVTFATHLEVTRTERFKEARNLANGEVNFTFTNESSGDSAVKFPTEMTLSLPLWINGDHIAIKTKLYYRVIEGRLSFWFKLMHLEETIDHLWNEHIGWLRSEAEGTLEAPVSPRLAIVYNGLPPTAPEPNSLD